MTAVAIALWLTSVACAVTALVMAFRTPRRWLPRDVVLLLIGAAATYLLGKWAYGDSIRIEDQLPAYAALLARVSTFVAGITLVTAAVIDVILTLLRNLARR